MKNIYIYNSFFRNEGQIIKILIADDHPAIIAGMCNYLTENYSSISIDTASNGKTLITSYLKNKPDLAIVDLSMPEVCNRIYRQKS